jgi:hypothetical protein
MKIRYVALAAAICCAAALLLLLSTHRRSGLGKYGLGEFKDFSPMEVYDMVLPVLTKYYLLRQDTGGTLLEKTIDYVNFYATPGNFTKISGLGSGGKSFLDNISLMFTSGNLYCSEQASFASMLLNMDVHIRSTDVVGHTFFEAKQNGHWSIVDPMYDMKIKNKNGSIASFDDMAAYVGGDKSVLQLPERISNRTLSYLQKFNSTRFTVSGQGRKTTFGEHHYFLKFDCTPCAGQSYEAFMETQYKTYKNVNRLFFKNKAFIYYSCRLDSDLSKGKNSLKDVYAVQDEFMKRIEKSYDGPFPWDVYKARQLQFLGRYAEARSIMEKLPKATDVQFYLSQIYYKQKDKDAFASLENALRSDIYYRYMYYQLMGSFLDANDSIAFSNFDYRDIRFAAPQP